MSVENSVGDPQCGEREEAEQGGGEDSTGVQCSQSEDGALKEPNSDL